MSNPLPDWIWDEWTRFSLSRRKPELILKNITGGSVRDAMDDLRAADPEAAMLLGEYIVLDDGPAGQANRE